MGERGNIAMVQHNYGKAEEGIETRSVIFFYTHWTGYRLEPILARALEDGKGRWGDETYLGRIIFQTLLEGNTGQTGYGISTYITDNSYTVLVVDDERQKVFQTGKREAGNLGSIDPIKRAEAFTILDVMTGESYTEFIERLKTAQEKETIN